LRAADTPAARIKKAAHEPYPSEDGRLAGFSDL
jgi:hypothetical protein